MVANKKSSTDAVLCNCFSVVVVLGSSAVTRGPQAYTTRDVVANQSLKTDVASRS